MFSASASSTAKLDGGPMAATNGALVMAAF